MRFTSVRHVSCSLWSRFSSTKSPAVELVSLSRAFKAHFLPLHKEPSVKWTVSPFQRGHKCFGCFYRGLSLTSGSPKRSFWILRNPFFPSSRAALTPWDSGSASWLAGGGRAVECLVFYTDQVLTESTTGCSTPMQKRKCFVCRQSCWEPFAVRQADHSQSCGPTCPTVPEHTPCAHADGDNVPIIPNVAPAEMIWLV